MPYNDLRRRLGYGLLTALTGLALSGCADSTTSATTAAVASVVLSSVTVVGGASVTATINLTAAAPAGGATITLASNTSTATVPASLVIAAGSLSGSFTITTTASAATSVITASYVGASTTASLTTTVVTVSTLQSLFLSTNVAAAGGPVQGTVTLTNPAPSGGMSIALTSSTTAVNVPASIVVPFNNTTWSFPVDVAALPVAPAATITASAAGVTKTATLTIGQLALSIDLASIPGGLPATGTVTLPVPAPDGGALVTLASSTPNASVPPAVVVPAGASSQTFAIATTNAPPTTTATLTATYAGATQRATLVVVAFPVVSGLSCSPGAVSGGAVVQCSGTLAGASAAGWPLLLASSNAAVVVPDRLTVAPGAQAFQFAMQTTTVTASTAVTVVISDASSGYALWTVALTVSP